MKKLLTKELIKMLKKILPELKILKNKILKLLQKPFKLWKKDYMLEMNQQPLMEKK
jgi:hypothetical protein